MQIIYMHLVIIVIKGFGKSTSGFGKSRYVDIVLCDVRKHGQTWTSEARVSPSNF